MKTNLFWIPVLSLFISLPAVAQQNQTSSAGWTNQPQFTRAPQPVAYVVPAPQPAFYQNCDGSYSNAVNWSPGVTANTAGTANVGSVAPVAPLYANGAYARPSYPVTPYPVPAYQPVQAQRVAASAIYQAPAKRTVRNEGARVKKPSYVKELLGSVATGFANGLTPHMCGSGYGGMCSGYQANPQLFLVGK